MLTTNATGADICSRALKYAGNQAAGEPMEAEIAADVLDIGNGMLDAWTMDRLYVYNSTISTYALTSGTQSYSIGATAAAPFAVLVEGARKIEADCSNIRARSCMSRSAASSAPPCSVASR